MADDFDSDSAPILECFKHRRWEHRKQGYERAKAEYEAGQNLSKYVAVHEKIVKERTRQVIQAGMDMMAAWAKKAKPNSIADAYPVLVAASMKGEGMKFAREQTNDFFLSVFESGMNLDQFVAPILDNEVMKDKRKSGPMAEVVAETLRAFGPKKVNARKAGEIAVQFLKTPSPGVKDAGARIFVELARYNFEKTPTFIADSISKALRKKVDASLQALAEEERSSAQPLRVLRGETIEPRQKALEEKEEEQPPPPKAKPQAATQKGAPATEAKATEGGDSGVDTEWREEEYTSYEEIVADVCRSSFGGFTPCQSSPCFLRNAEVIHPLNTPKQAQDPGPPRDCFTSMPQEEYKDHIGAFPRKWSDRKAVYDSIQAACRNVGCIQANSKATKEVLGVLKMYLDYELHQFNTRDLMVTIAMVTSKLDNQQEVTKVFTPEQVERICTVFGKNRHAHPGIVNTLKEFYKAGYTLQRMGAALEAGSKARQPMTRLVMFEALQQIVVDNFGNEAARKDFGQFFILQQKWDLLMGCAASDRDVKVKAAASKFLAAFVLMIGDNKKFNAQWESNTNKQLKKRVAEATPELKVLYDAANGEPRVERRPVKKKRMKKRPGMGGKKKRVAASAAGGGGGNGDGKTWRKVRKRRKEEKAAKKTGGKNRRGKGKNYKKTRSSPQQKTRPKKNSKSMVGREI